MWECGGFYGADDRVDILRAWDYTLRPLHVDLAAGFVRVWWFCYRVAPPRVWDKREFLK